MNPLLLMLAMVGLSACVDSHHRKPASQQGAQAISVEVIYGGIQCGGFAADTSASWIEDATQLESLYRQLSLAPVELDFDRSTVVLVEMGERPTLGYRLELVQPAAKMVEGGVEVVLKWHEPSSDMMVGQMMTSPCLLLRLERGQYRDVWIVNSHGQRKAGLHLQN